MSDLCEGLRLKKTPSRWFKEGDKRKVKSVAICILSFKLNFQVYVSVLEKDIAQRYFLQFHPDNCFEIQMKTQEMPH